MKKPYRQKRENFMEDCELVERDTAEIIRRIEALRVSEALSIARKIEIAKKLVSIVERELKGENQL